MKLMVIYNFTAFGEVLPYGTVVEGEVYFNDYFKEDRVHFKHLPGRAFKLMYFSPILNTRLIGV